MTKDKKFDLKKVTVKKGKALERTLSVSLGYELVNQIIERRMAKLSKTVKLKGFRPGKVPRRVLDQYYADQVKFESEEELVRETIGLAFKEQDINPAGMPTIASMNKNNDTFEYTISYEDYPVIKLKGMNRLKLARVNAAVEDENIQEMLNRLQEQKATWTKVDREAQLEDKINVNFEGRIDNEVFEGGKAEKVDMLLGKKQLIEDFEKGLIGIKSGESKTIAVKFPEDYPADQLKGKNAEFSVTCHYVEEKSLPDLDAEFLESIGFKDKTMDDLKNEIRDNLEKELKVNLSQINKKRVFDILLEKNKFDTPQTLVHEEIQALEKDFKSRQGLKEEDSLPEDVKFDEVAKERVDLSLILQQIVKDKDMKVEESDIEAKLEEIVSVYPNSDDMKRNYRNNHQLMGQLESQILEENIIDYVFSEAKTSEEKLSFDKVMNYKEG
jgi:trigger factor